MKCPKCQFENPETRKFCCECGEKLILTCPQCSATILPGDKFCGECGHRLKEGLETAKVLQGTEGERKQVTVLFSDLSGSTSMSEKLDPEEVKEIMSRIFGEIAQVVAKYEGFIEKFIGDAVMALFGVPKSHEDDPVRAVKAAIEIHDLIESISPQLEDKIGQPLSMHSGINTGLVVTGEINLEQGTHGLTGETINLASRLQNLAKASEILVGKNTYRQTEGYFDFEELAPTKVKGKEKTVSIYRMLSKKDKPVTTHRLSGLRADLIGRKAELAQLAEAVENLLNKKGKIFSICGDSGTGKSRLVEEFKATLDLEKIQWLEGHAYAYSQNITYFPLIDLLNRAFQIEEGDSPEKVRQKIESEIEDLVGKKENVVSYIGSLYSLSYPDIEEMSPELWKSRLRDAVQMVLSAFAQRAPTIFLLEDLHWADPSFVELLRNTLFEVRKPAIVLCVYRPIFGLFTTHQLKSITRVYQEIRLRDLSSSEAQDMLESLLKTDNIPPDLWQFFQDKAEGNPFYLEELINSLIEAKTLIRDKGSWKLTKTINESDISSTIHGVISGRLDHLNKETKRILQEASVIGRSFLYEILKRITELKHDINQFLRGLEQLDIIRIRSLQPDLEYIFKHALIQEVVYYGLIKKERQEIHERIAHVMEQTFHERLPEFYETLAFHFAKSKSVIKAVDYLAKSGEKSLNRYAVEESHKYFKKAFDLLTNKPDKTKEEEGLLIDLLIKWAFVFHYRGDFRSLKDLLAEHENLANGLGDRERLGMYYTLLGLALYQTGAVKDAYQSLCKALKIGEEIENQKIIGYACTWLSWNCPELGLLDEAIHFGKRALEISRLSESEDYLFFNSLGGMGLAYWYRGERKNAFKTGKVLLDYGQRYTNIRSLVLGHFIIGCSHIIDGDLPSATECFQKATEVSEDPWYSQFPRMMLCFTHILEGQIQEAEDALAEVLNYSSQFGTEIIRTPALMMKGLVTIAKGHMSQGLKILEDAHREDLARGRRYAFAIEEHIMGKVFMQIAEGEPIGLSMVKNIGFLLKNLPFARRNAKDHFNKSIDVAKEIGAKSVLGQAYLDLGLLCKAKGETNQARECITEAIQILEKCEAEAYIRQARKAMETLR